MSLKTPENAKFVKDFLGWLKEPKVTGVDFNVSGVDPKGRVTCSPMNLSRMGVYLWKQAVEKAGSFDVDAVLGDYRGRPWDDRADVWIIMAKKR
jgi:urea transport system substrate-binding protein